MPDRDKNEQQPSPARAGSPQRDDRSDAPQDTEVESSPESDAEQSTASRPRGHTEEPDRTL
jgi:hypothetical protein